MKAHYRSANGRLVFEIEGDSPKALFEQVALLEDVFEADDKCGQCGSQNIRFRVRNVKTQAGKDVRYFELRCIDCWAQFDYGQSQGTVNLFPKRREKMGTSSAFVVGTSTARRTKAPHDRC